MFAVIKTGGKQYKIAANDKLKIEKLEGEPGSSITFSEVLMIDADVGAPLLKGAVVTAEIMEQVRSGKSISFVKRRRQNSKRKKGHRQELTLVRIDGIYKAGETPKAVAKTAKPKAEKADAPVKKAAAAKAPAAKKAPAKKAPAKKAAAKE